MKRLTWSDLWGTLHILAILGLLFAAMRVAAQDPNPQSSFASTESLAGPSLELNFNDQTTSFRDQISGSSFVNTKTITSPDGQTIAGDFNGTNNYIGSISSSALTPGTGNWSFGAWVQTTSSADGYVMCNESAVTSGNAHDWCIEKWSDNKARILYVDDNATHSVNFASTATIADGNWHLIVGVYSSATNLVYLYLDGALAATSSSLAGFTGITTTSLYIGRREVFWNGLVSDAFAYNAALTLAQVQTLYAGGTVASGLVGQWWLNEGTGSTAIDSVGGHNGTWSGTASGNLGYYEGGATYTSGTVTPRQPGFDSTLLNNTSAEFPWNGFSAAPNNTLGAIEWNTPWSMMVQVDRLNWSRTGTLVLASKGDLASGTYWQLYLQMTANTMSGANGQVSQLCFARSGIATGTHIYGRAANGICTSSQIEAMPNGFNYNIIVTDSGTGASGLYSTTSALDIHINGLGTETSFPETPFTTSYQYGFGAVDITYSGGTGYAATTAFTSSGGGANCNVTGTLYASGGVPNGISFGFDYGCTSVPTISLTSPTGTGVTLTPSLSGASMNSTNYPVMVPGYVSGAAYYGIAGATSSQTPTYIDEFAIFPSSLNQTQINDLFYWTRFYQTLWNIHGANRPVLLLATDGCSDISNAMMMQFVIILHQQQIIKLEGVVSAGMSWSDIYDSSASFWRQMLDEAGLSDIPVGNLYAGGDYDHAWCLNANLNSYNASTPQVSTGFPSSASVVRTVMARNPTTPVIIYNGPAPANNWLSDFLQSPADSISSLTGQQLWDRDVANGGAMWWQGSPSCLTSTYPSPTPCSGSWTTLDATASQYVFSHLDGMPTYQVQNTPQGTGQGMIHTRTSKDPTFLACNIYAPGGCGRAGWGQYALAALFSSYFTNGVYVGYSGGTGYANLTPFTSTGGGANCVVNGIMTASGGVPNGIETPWGAPQPWNSVDSQPQGLGSGCTSAPTLVLTAPTGTGVTLTAYPTTVCGTGSVSGSTYSFSSTTCNYQYVVPFTERWLGLSEQISVVLRWRFCLG